MEIFEPAVLCVTVPNRQFVDAVEACFGSTQLRTFVAQCEDDYQLLNRLCVDTPEALGKKARINTWFKARDESKLQPPPLSVDQLRAEGFDGYALEFVDCPEGLKWFLCADVRLHRTVRVFLRCFRRVNAYTDCQSPRAHIHIGTRGAHPGEGEHDEGDGDGRARERVQLRHWPRDERRHSLQVRQAVAAEQDDGRAAGAVARARR